MATNSTAIDISSMSTAPMAAHDDGISPFHSINSFTDAWRMARCLSASSMVPDAFRGEMGTPNCMIALELASRLKTSIFMIMQNLYIIHGRPAFSAQFVIASIQACGRYSPLKYEYRRDAKGKPFACKAVATELATGERLEGPEVSMEMAQSEGWLAKSGSKWKTMPEVMLRYRAASFFGRAYAPDVMMGFRSAEEVYDSEPSSPAKPATPTQDAVEISVHDEAAKPKTNQSKTDALNALLAEPDEAEQKPAQPDQKPEEPKPDQIQPETAAPVEEAKDPRRSRRQKPEPEQAEAAQDEEQTATLFF